MRTLYEITDDFKKLLSLMLDSECDPEIIADTMEGMEGELSIKLDNYKIVDAELEAQEEKIDKEIKRLSAEKSSIGNHRANIKQRMFDAVALLPEQKIDTPHYKMKLVNNGGKQPMTITEDNVPEAYKKMVWQIDKDKIREELEKGIVFDFAQLEPRGQRLSIK